MKFEVRINEVVEYEPITVEAKDEDEAERRALLLFHANQEMMYVRAQEAREVEIERVN